MTPVPGSLIIFTRASNAASTFEISAPRCAARREELEAFLTELRVSVETTRRVMRRFGELEREQAAGYYRRLVGRRLEVLVEGADPRRPGHALGTSCRYAPVSFTGHAPALLGRQEVREMLERVK